MPRNIPKNTILRQSNRSDRLGDIVESYNIDLSSNQGSVRTTKCKLVFDETDDSDFGSGNSGVSTIEFFDNGLAVGSGGRYWIGGNAPSDSLTQDVTGGTPSGLQTTRSSGSKFNDGIYLPSLSSVEKYTGSAWSTISGLNGSSPHITTVMDDKLYITNLYDKVGHVTSGDVLNLTGPSTLDLDLFGYTITFFESANDRIWIGVASNNNAGICWVYEWDGADEDSFTRRYTIEANGIVSGKLKDGIPYIVDTRGRLLVLSGTGFLEVDRFPVGNETFYQFESNFIAQRIHPKGMAVLGDELLINISNLKNSSTVEFFDFPAGVWAWSRETGLYHKYSPSLQPASDTGTTNLTDYGQMRFADAGPITIIDPVEPTSTDNGLVVFGLGYYADADNADSDQLMGLFTSDELDTSQKWGYFVTSKEFSAGVEDTWSKVYNVYKKLLNSTDKIVVKYRTEEDVPTEATITWSDTDTFTSTTDLSDYEEGDEVQVVQGIGSGKSAHISSISESGCTYTVNLDDTFTGATGTAIAKLSKWIKAGEITDEDEKQWKAHTITKKNISPWIQLKVAMQFTGKNELYRTRIINSPNVNE